MPSPEFMYQARTFIIIQDFSSFRFSWRRLHDPSNHNLILVTNNRHYAALESAGEIQWFSEVIRQSKFDKKTLKTTIEDLIKTRGIKKGTIYLICNDEDSIAATATVAEQLKIQSLGKEFVQNFTNKLLMKELLESKGIRVPKHVKWDPRSYNRSPEKTLLDIEKVVGYPCFAKPFNGSGSINTRTISSRQELVQWCKAHEHTNDYEIDEFISGTLYHCDSIIDKGNVLFTQVSRYFCNGHDFLSGSIDASITLAQSDSISKHLSSYAKTALLALGIEGKSFVTHMEIFMANDSYPVFLEVAARAPGGRVVPTYQRRLGCNFEELNFRLQMGLFRGVNITKGPYAAWASFPSREGTVTKRNKLLMSSPHKTSWRVAPGDRLKNPRDVADYVVAVEAWNDDPEALENDMNALSCWEPCSYESTSAPISNGA